MRSFYQLFLANLKMTYRNRGGMFFSIIMPAGLYIALSLLPIPSLTGAVLYKDYVLPGIIAYTIMTNGIYGLAYWMTDMKARGVIKRLLVTPIKASDVVLSLIASRIFVMFLQVTILTLIGIILFDAKFAGHVLSILGLTVMGGSIFLLVGLLIANVANSYETAAPLTAAIGMPMIFFGNVFFPTENLPGVLKTISQILPVTYLADGLRHAYLYDFNWQVISTDILILFLWLLLTLAVTIKVFKLKEE